MEEPLASAKSTLRSTPEWQALVAHQARFGEIHMRDVFAREPDRSSLWSAIGLTIALAIGMDRFTELPAGGRAMHEHFRSAPLESNMPVSATGSAYLG